LGRGIGFKLNQKAAARSAQLANDVLSGAMNGQNCAAFESFGLTRRRCLEWLFMRTEPGLDDAVAAQALVHSTGNGLDLGQLRHGSIVTDEEVGKWRSEQVKE
jgi:hypothetical protein